MARVPQPNQLRDLTDPHYISSTLGFISEALQEGQAFLQAQPNFSLVERSERAIHGKHSNVLSGGTLGGLSDVTANHIAKAATKLVSGMTDTRPFWEYRTFNPNSTKTVEILGKLALHLWLNKSWDMRWADAIRGCTTGGTSYPHQYWNFQLQSLDLQAEDVRDVLPIRPNSYHTIQDAFGVIMRRERTVNYLKAQYPEYADFIKADRDGSAQGQHDDTRYNRLMERLGSPFWNNVKARQQPARDIPRIPTADELHVYIDDPAINESNSPMYMGDWHLAPVDQCPQCMVSGTPHSITNWSYVVQKGERIYPCKRLIIALPGSNLIVYDNTSIYWHGLYPFPKLTLDPWQGTFIGKGLIWDALPMQRLLDRWFRLMDNHMQKWQQPDLVVDKNSTSVSEFNKINTARPGVKMRLNPVAGKMPEFRYPDAMPAYLVELGKFFIEQIGTLTGAHDVSQIAQLGQLPSSDSVERLMEAMTPEVRLRSRILESFTREFAQITAFNIAQFMTQAERIAILGPDGVVESDFDYDPGTLIPDYIHAGDFDDMGHPTAEAIARGPMPRRDRTREFMRQTSMHIAPGSLLHSSEITDKLMYLTLWREGGIDLITMLEKLGIPGVETIVRRLAEQAAIGIGIQQQGVGRPPTAQEMPSGKPRSDGSGIKISESG